MSYTLAYTGAEIDALLGKIDAIFVAEYGSTIYSEVTAAIAAGNKVIVANAGKVYVYAGQDDNGGYVFTQSGPNAAKPNATYVTLSTGNVWSTATVDLATLQQFYASLVEDTASGSIASFPDGAENVPVKELTADIEPIQDLHGYDNPWPDGGNKNKAQMLTTDASNNGITCTANSDGTVNISGTADGNATITLINNYAEVKALVEAGGTFALSANNGATYNASTFNVTLAYSQSGTTKFLTLGNVATIPSGVTFLSVTVYVGNGTAVASQSHFALQLEASSSVTPFVPYSNICPIEGYTGAEITRTGKNLFDKGNPNAVTRHIYIGGHTLPYNANARTVYIPCKPNTTYTVSRIAGQRFIVAYTIDEPTTAVTTYGEIVDQTASSITITTGADARYLVVFCYLSTADTLTFQQILDSLQIELGSTATAYEAYNGTVYSVSWSDHGTVYKGTAKYKGGGEWEITATYAGVDMSTISWTYQSAYPRYQGLMPNSVNASSRAADCYCSVVGMDTSIQGGENYLGFHSGQYLFVYSTDDEATFASKINGQLLVYPLASPTSFTVTGPTPETLLGDNNIWSNTGDISVKYRANTALYIEKKLGE